MVTADMQPVQKSLMSARAPSMRLMLVLHWVLLQAVLLICALIVVLCFLQVLPHKN